jgi:hypothetical protein
MSAIDRLKADPDVMKVLQIMDELAAAGGGRIDPEALMAEVKKAFEPPKSERMTPAELAQKLYGLPPLGDNHG